MTFIKVADTLHKWTSAAIASATASRTSTDRFWVRPSGGGARTTPGEREPTHFHTWPANGDSNRVDACEIVRTDLDTATGF